jgi:hypothetical protein
MSLGEVATAEGRRLREDAHRKKNWRRRGPCLLRADAQLRPEQAMWRDRGSTLGITVGQRY